MLYDEIRRQDDDPIVDRMNHARPPPLIVKLLISMYALIIVHVLSVD